jgi:cyclophilin family peptidyl-prolyl cis-trans isomerase/HEAT repeat protein
MKPHLLTTVLALASLMACTEGGPSPERDARLVEIMDLEDQRSPTAELGDLLIALEDRDPAVVRVAVRGLGRLERPELLDDLSLLLDHRAPSVRAEAANAVAQATYGRPSERALELLRARVGEEDDPAVRRALAHSLGRLWVAEDEDVDRRVASILELGSIGSAETTEGVALGLYYLMLRTRGEEPSHERARSWLEEHMADPDVGVRRITVITLNGLGDVPAPVVDRLLGDEDAQVRLRALALLGPEGDGPAKARSALTDPDGGVRAAALRSVARFGTPQEVCEAALSSLDDSDMHVQVAALDVLSTPCPDRSEQVESLEGIASGITGTSARDWHPSAHALVSLATVSPERAAPLVESFARHENYFVQAYGARAAGLVGNVPLLRELASYGHPNVRTVTARALVDLTGREADDVLLRLLAVQDPQLVLTAARFLEGSSLGREVLVASLSALDGLTNLRRETTRDPRMELLARIREYGTRMIAPRMRRYLRDMDPLVAAEVADMLSEWQGEPVVAAPLPAPRERFPGAEELNRMRSVSVVLQMVPGEIEIRLFPDEAPTNAARFLRMAERGYFDGLTFHRVVSNFVIQGGSPNANEYAGDAAFSRDELGLRSHRRGTVGVSTRGRDTGDGQIFINTVDNFRLDHDYTILGEVVRGMEVVDAVREGDVILQARVEG